MKYKAEDGATFNTEAEALDHEKKIEAEKQEKAEKERLERIKKENEVGIIKVMDDSGIALVCFPKQILEEDGIKATSKALLIKSLKEQKSKGDIEPKIEFKEKATFNLEYVLNYLLWMKKQGATNISLFVKTGEPLLVKANIPIKEYDEDGIEKEVQGEIKFWLAPYETN